MKAFPKTGVSTVNIERARKFGLFLDTERKKPKSKSNKFVKLHTLPVTFSTGGTGNAARKTAVDDCE